MEIEIDGFDTWDGFDRIAEVLRINHKSLEIRKTDGIDSRANRFLTDGVLFWLIFDDMIGNFFKAESREDLEKLKNLAGAITQTMRARYL